MIPHKIPPDGATIKKRLLVSLGSNVARAVIGFASGLLVARGLNPDNYGDLMFLLGSFVAVRSLLDIGSSSAFYTFISQRPRSLRFYIYYLLWLVLQFVVTVLLVTMIMPEWLLGKIWLGHSRNIVFLAFVASFVQQQVWQTITQIGEASRKTILVQGLGLGVVVVHLACVYLMFSYNWMSIKALFLVLIIEYSMAAGIACWLLQRKKDGIPLPSAERSPLRVILKEYWAYSRPLAMTSWVIFLGEFADKWLLQRFGGANQQGYFQVASQFSVISLLATSSVLNIFWKEVAEAHEQKKWDVVAALYHRVNRGLVMVSAGMSGFLIPWTREIVGTALGQQYALSVPAFMVMFLYPVHQSMGQVGSVMLWASGRTNMYMKLVAAVSFLSLPLAYIVQAPTSDPFLPGLGLGAVGMALKTVAVNIISVNVLAWMISRYYRWEFDWFYQVSGLAISVVVGYVSKTGILGVFGIIAGTGKQYLLPSFVLSGIAYSGIMFSILWWMPWLIGMERKEMVELVKWKGRSG
jgi:O-antigen/teichoic acid export membrane protein